MLEIVLLSLCVLLIIALAVEPFYVRRLRDSFEHVILIAGTRGKTTVTRLIGGALRYQGIPTFTKVTGTLPVYIDTDGSEHPLRRLGPANIREQVKMMRLARKRNAKVLVIESMAIRQEYAKISQHKMLQANHVVITNCRNDHVEDFATPSELLAALQAVIPSEGHLHVLSTDKDSFEKCSQNSHATVHVASEFFEDETVDFYPENIALALSVCESLGIERNRALEGMRHLNADIGKLSLHILGKTTFVNALAVNDITSIIETYEKIQTHPLIKDKPLTVFVNNRLDRPKRSIDHLTWLKTLPLQRVIVSGPFFHRFKRTLTCEVVRLDSPSDFHEDACVFAIGNMKNMGMKVLAYIQDKGEPYNG